jgi:hypothetical protein
MTRGRRRRARPARTPRLVHDRLILLDDSPRVHRGLISKTEAAVIAAVIVVIVTVAGVIAFRPHTTPAASSLPILGSVPAFPTSAAPSATPTATGSATPRPAPTRTATPAPAQTPAQQATTPPATGVFVTYRVVQQWYTGFEGEVSVVNDEPSSISGWEMAIALPDDTFTAWWNASGYVSNGILLLSPSAWSGSISANGGTLNVFFVARGEQTTPADCGFDTYDCVYY